MRTIQPSFAAGELSPGLYARVDLTKYKVGARRLTNFIVHPHGGASNRAGTDFVCETEEGARLVPFQYNVEQTYMLVFLDGYLQVLKDGGQVVIPLCDGGDYKWTASGSGTNEYYLEAIGGGDPSIVREPDNVDEDGAAMTAGTVGSLAAGEWDWDDNDALGFDTIYVRLSDNSDPDTHSAADTYYVQCIFEAVSPFAVSNDLFLMRYSQSADTMFLTHKTYAVRELTRTDHHKWAFSSTTFSPSVSAPTGLNGSYDGTGSFNVDYKVAAVIEGEESLPSSAKTVSADTQDNWEVGKTVSLTWTDPTGVDYWRVYKDTRGYYGWIGNADSNAFTDDNIIPDESDGPQAANAPFSGAGDYPAAVSIYQQRTFFGRTNNDPQTVWSSQTGFLRNLSTSTPLKDSDAIEATLASAQVNEIRHFIPMDALMVFTSGAEWVMSPGSNSDALTPTSVQYKLQSYYGSAHVPPLVIGGTVMFVQQGGRVVRDFAYYLEADKYQGNDLTVLSEHLFAGKKIVSWAYQANPDSIVWVVLDDGSLLAFTYLREHEVWAWTPMEIDGDVEDVGCIRGDDEDEVYFIIKRTIGGSDVRYIEKLHSRDFNHVEDAYFVDCGLTWSGWNAVTDDYLKLTQIGTGGYGGGTVVTLTATGHTPFSAGSVGDTYVLEGAGGDRVRVVVTEYTNTSTVKAQLQADCPTDLQNTNTATWAETATTFSGLDHLEGETAAILGDGSVFPQQEVTSGAVTISQPVAVAHIGLPYTATMETLDVDFNLTDGTVQGRKKVVSKLTLRLRDTVGAWVGQEDDYLIEVPFRENEDYFEPTALFNGDKDITIQGIFTSGGRIIIQQRDPLPITVLAVIPEVVVGG